ncbi:PssE/Cps14G family polysaccharide biosynthesis glycosyltransferase [Bacillus solitudinis]|uniref:PssE/Cps14G family polysaccharide biosynthesis glycosyltransferase n=1 Tax=Bacillus solitudinis TaxID=2014074 RepID=UPI000C241094|nr:PssE/Cps14G family polysaccharide biosynthesis glycosyltransferase [Bacillus solitudinis]
MIFVVLGTHELSFHRLLQEVERLQEQGTIQDEIVVQLGHTIYQSDKMKLIPFMNYSEMERYFEEADLVITHAGTGSIITGVKKGKKVIAVARRAAHQEHNDDHQVEIVEQFTNTGYILGMTEVDELESKLAEVESFQPAPFQSGREQMLKLIENFIDGKS